MVAIKGMEVPKSCAECDIKTGAYCYAKSNPPYKLDHNVYCKRADDCPLVKIITCKDCKYYREDDDSGHCTNHTCGDITFWCHDDYYCADAEKKEDARHED